MLMIKAQVFRPVRLVRLRAPCPASISRAAVPANRPSSVEEALGFLAGDDPAIRPIGARLDDFEAGH
jgi:hypothetical protein